MFGCTKSKNGNSYTYKLQGYCDGCGAVVAIGNVRRQIVVENQVCDLILFQQIDACSENGNGYHALVRMLVGQNETIPSPRTYEKLLFHLIFFSYFNNVSYVITLIFFVCFGFIVCRYNCVVRLIVTQQYEQHMHEVLEELRTDPNATYDRYGRQLISVSHDGSWANSSTSFSSTNGFNTGITTINGKPQIVSSGTKTKG